MRGGRQLSMKMPDLKLSRVISRKCLCLSLLDMAELRVKRRYGSPLVPHGDKCLMWFAAGSPSTAKCLLPLAIARSSLHKALYTRLLNNGADTTEVAYLSS